MARPRVKIMMALLRPNVTLAVEQRHLSRLVNTPKVINDLTPTTPVHPKVVKQTTAPKVVRKSGRIIAVVKL